MTTLFQRILESRRVAQDNDIEDKEGSQPKNCLLYTSPSPRDA